jgi:hypothetical protein
MVLKIKKITCLVVVSAFLIALTTTDVMCREEKRVVVGGVNIAYASLTFSQGKDGLIAFGIAPHYAGDFALTRFDIGQKITATGLAATPFLRLRAGDYFSHAVPWGDDLLVTGNWSPAPVAVPGVPLPPPVPAQPRIVVIPGSARTTTDASLMQLRPAALVDAAAPVAGVVDTPIANVAIAGDKVLVAVPQRGADFEEPGANDRGIAVLERDGNELVQARNGGVVVPTAAIDLTALRDDNAVRKLVFSDHTIVVGGPRRPIAEAELSGATVLMCWDDTLQRLYFGLSGLKKDDAACEGGVVGIGVGRFVGGNFEIEPLVVDPTAGIFGFVANPGGNAGADSNSMDRVVGFYHGRVGVGNLPPLTPTRADPRPNIGITVRHLKTMRTSTGKSYLIAGTEVGVTRRHGRKLSGLYCVPLVDDVANAAHHGKLRARAAAGPAARFDELPTHELNRITRYRNPMTGLLETINIKADQVTDIQVLGDSILISVQARGGSILKSGVYVTTALFNVAGDIIGWTPMKLTGGVDDDAYAAQIDTKTGNLAWLGPNKQSVRVSTWDSLPRVATQLQDLVTKHFPAATGGVRGVVTFDAATPTFNQHPGGARFVPGGGAFVGVLNDQRIGLAVVLGYDKVMLVQLMQGGRVVALDDVVGSPTQNVFVFHNDDLKKIAPLTCAEVLKVASVSEAFTALAGPLPTQNLGYLYVGGFNGVCRLQATAAGGGYAVGEGWQTRQASVAPVLPLVPNPTHAFMTGLTDLRAYITGGAAPNFVRLPNHELKDVTQLVSTVGAVAGGRTRMVAVCNDGYVVGDLVGRDLVTPKVMMPAETHIFDAVLVKDFSAVNDQSHLVLATRTGLRVEPLGFAVPPAVHIEPLPNGDLPIQFSYVPPSKGGVGAGDIFANGGAGTLYVLAGTQAMDKTRVYCYAVQWDALPANVLRLVGQTPEQLTPFKRYFGSDGCQALMVRDKALDNNDVAAVGLLNDIAHACSVTQEVAPDAQLKDFVCAPQRDPSLGSWLVPGSFGLKING